MNVLLSACEASSDLHAALVAQALVDLKPADQELKIWGIGGDQLSQVREFECLIPSRHLLSMGFFAVLAKLPVIHRSLKIMSHEAQLRKPQVAIVFDYPDFHFKLAKALNRLNIPCVDMIPPKVWVWRKSRLKVMKVIFDAVINIFPFERSLYDKAQIKNVYFGNPLIEKLPRNIQNTRDKNEMIALSRASLRELGFQVNNDETVLTVMPGSRHSELKYHTQVMLESAVQFLKSQSQPRILWVMNSNCLSDSVVDFARTYCESRGIAFTLVVNQSLYALAAAQFGLIKSGTATLEAAWVQCPHVVGYTGAWITRWLFKIIIQGIMKYRGPVALSNLALGVIDQKEVIFPEYLSEKFTVDHLVHGLERLQQDQELNIKMETHFKKIKELYRLEESPSRKIAAWIWATYG